MIIGVDVDDVTLDLVEAWVAEYNRRWNDNQTPSDWSDWDLTKVVKPECGERVYEILKDPHLYDRVYPMAYALDGVTHLRQAGHRVVFITACGYEHETITASSGAKLHALQKWGLLSNDRKGVTDFVIAADKTLVTVDVMIDDRASTIKQFGKKGIIFDRPHNRDYYHLDGYRVHGWYEIPRVIREISQKQVTFNG